MLVDILVVKLSPIKAVKVLEPFFLGRFMLHHILEHVLIVTTMKHVEFIGSKEFGEHILVLFENVFDQAVGFGQQTPSIIDVMPPVSLVILKDL